MVHVDIKSELHLLIDSIEEEEVLMAVKALLEKCAPPQKAELTPAQASEIERRLEMLRNGETELYDADQVLEEIRMNLVMQRDEAQEQDHP